MLTVPFLLGILLTRVDGVAIDNSVEGEPIVECLEEEIRFSVKTRKLFGGRIFAKGKVEQDDCMSAVFAQERTDSPSISLSLGACGMESLESTPLQVLLFQSDPRGMYYGITIVVSFHPLFLTKVDQAYHTRCFFEEAEKGLKAELGVSMIPSTMTNAVHGVGGCKYTIHQGKPGEQSVLEGPEIQFARIGDSVMHKWACSDAMMGILIKNCHVTDGMGQRAEVIDQTGCPVDPILVSGIRYSSDLNEAFAESHVFKFADRPGLWFFCEVQMCMKAAGHCEGLTPPRCGAGPSVSPVQLYVKDSVAEVDIELTAEGWATENAEHIIKPPDINEEQSITQISRSHTHVLPTATPTNNIRRKPPYLEPTGSQPGTKPLPTSEANFAIPITHDPLPTFNADNGFEVGGQPPAFGPVQAEPEQAEQRLHSNVPGPNDPIEDEFPGVPVDAFKGPSRYEEPSPTRLPPAEQISLFGPPPRAPPIGVIFEAHDYIKNIARDSTDGNNSVANDKLVTPTAILSVETKHAPASSERRGKASISVIPNFGSSGGRSNINLRPDGRPKLEVVGKTKTTGKSTTLPPYKGGLHDMFTQRTTIAHQLDAEPETTGEIAGQLIVYDLDEEVPSFLRSADHPLGPFNLDQGPFTSPPTSEGPAPTSACPVDSKTFQGIIIGTSTAISVLLFTTICLFRRATRRKSPKDIVSYRDIDTTRARSRVRSSEAVEAQRHPRKSRKSGSS